MAASDFTDSIRFSRNQLHQLKVIAERFEMLIEHLSHSEITNATG
jgi:hypothetical protein